MQACTVEPSDVRFPAHLLLSDSSACVPCQWSLPCSTSEKGLVAHWLHGFYLSRILSTEIFLVAYALTKSCICESFPSFRQWKKMWVSWPHLVCVCLTPFSTPMQSKCLFPKLITLLYVLTLKFICLFSSPLSFPLSSFLSLSQILWGSDRPLQFQSQCCHQKLCFHGQDTGFLWVYFLTYELEIRVAILDILELLCGVRQACSQ